MGAHAGDVGGSLANASARRALLETWDLRDAAAKTLKDQSALPRGHVAFLRLKRCQPHGLSERVIAATPLPTAMKCAFAAGRRLRRAYNAHHGDLWRSHSGYTPVCSPMTRSPRESAGERRRGWCPNVRGGAHWASKSLSPPVFCHSSACTEKRKDARATRLRGANKPLGRSLST